MLRPPGAPPDETPSAAPAGQAYNSLSIVQPAPDETFFGADAVVSVVAELYPTLRPGDIIALPARMPHAFRNPGPGVLRLLGIHANPERIVHRLAEA